MSAARRSRGKEPGSAPKGVPRPPDPEPSRVNLAPVNASTHTTKRETPFSLRGIIVDVCRRSGIDPAEVMAPVQRNRMTTPKQFATTEAAPTSEAKEESFESSEAVRPHQVGSRPAAVDPSSAAAMARAVCSMDDDTFWIVYLALSVEFERRFGDDGLARKVAGHTGARGAASA